MRSNNVLSVGSPSHFLRIIAFRMLSLGAFSSQSIMITLERSRFSEDKSCQRDVQNNYSYGYWVMRAQSANSDLDFKSNPWPRTLCCVILGQDTKTFTVTLFSPEHKCRVSEKGSEKKYSLK